MRTGKMDDVSAMMMLRSDLIRRNRRAIRKARIDLPAGDPPRVRWGRAAALARHERGVFHHLITTTGTFIGPSATSETVTTMKSNLPPVRGAV